MGKKIVLLTVLALVVALTAAVTIYVVVDRNTVKSFSLRDAYYQRILQEFAVNCSTEPVNSANDAKQAAEEIWIKIYGADTILNEKPYMVYYDETEEVWLVTGSLPPLTLGGVAKILVRRDGTVLAVWHEK